MFESRGGLMIDYHGTEITVEEIFKGVGRVIYLTLNYQEKETFARLTPEQALALAEELQALAKND